MEKRDAFCFPASRQGITALLLLMRFSVIFRLMALALLAVGLFACAGNPAQILTLKEAGETIEIGLDSRIEVRLDSNPTTGYSWAFEQDPLSLLDTVMEPSFTRGAAEDGAVGVGGMETFVFSASRRGETKLRFEYRRPWTEGKLPSNVVTYKIKVQ